VFVAARTILFVAFGVEPSPQNIAAWYWQDVVLLMLFALGSRLLPARWLWGAVYAALVILVAFNAPVALDLGSPITMAMLRAARGTLSDSLLHHATPLNLTITASLIVLGMLVPRAWTLAFPPRDKGPAKHPAAIRSTLSAAVLLAVLTTLVGIVGRWASASSDTHGMERNVVFAIASTALPRVRGVASDVDWRASLAGRTAAGSGDLHALRGVAAGSNVLLVVLESTGAQYLRPYGAARDPTPAFTALADSSLLFENAYAVYPESVRGMVSFLSSRYPAFDVSNEEHARVAAPSLASELGRAGYSTALFHSGRFIYLGMDTLVRASGFGLMEDAGHIGGNHESSFGVDEPATVRRILEWLDSHPRGRPFFVTWLPIEGHHPYTFQPPAPFPAETDIDRYHNALFDADRSMGVLLDGLRRRGLDSNTVVVVTSDHAQAFGQHPGNFGHTLAIYEENVRVPLLVALPAGRRMARRVPGVASLVDIPPTLLALLGMPQPAEFQGTSLLEARDQMALFFTDYSMGILGARDGCTKFIHELETRRSRMFNVCADPGETADLASREPALATRYLGRVTGWAAAQISRLGR
jgi:hypothetical protein